MKLKKLFFCLTIFSLILVFSGCGEKKETAKEDKTENKVQDEQKEEKKQESQKVGSFVTNGEIKEFFNSPEEGEEIVAMTVKDFGVLRFKLFPEVAPVAVENFKKLVREGKYDGTSFHRVIKDFMIQGGAEAESKGEVKKTQVELNKTARHYNGALCVARSQSLTDGQGCQFYIVCSDYGKTADFDKIKQMTDANYRAQGLNIKVDFDEKTRENYKREGGRPDLDMNYTVFGRLIQGDDVVKKISETPKKKIDPQQQQMMNAPAQMEESEPETPVIIEKAVIEKY